MQLYMQPHSLCAIPNRQPRPPVDVWVALVTHQAVLLAVVQPVPGAPRAYEPLQAVGLHPDELIHAPVTPLGQQLTAQLQRTAWQRHSSRDDAG